MLLLVVCQVGGWVDVCSRVKIINNSVTGNRTLVSRVTGGDTNHYTMTDSTGTNTTVLHFCSDFSGDIKIRHVCICNCHYTHQSSQITHIPFTSFPSFQLKSNQTNIPPSAAKDTRKEEKPEEKSSRGVIITESLLELNYI